MEQSRWRSPMFWSLIFTQVIAIITALNLWTFIGITADTATQIAAAIVAILAAVVNGVNNPTNPTGW